MRIRVLALILASTAAVGSGTGCIWITEEQQAAFSDRDGDGLDNAEDCDDSNKNIQGTVQFYPDVDGDGFGDMNAQPKEFCPSEAPADHVQDNTDCNDNNDGALPGGTEVCDLQNIDEDCDGAADDADAEAEGKLTWYADADGDTYGDMDDPGTLACDAPGTAVQDNTDCDDSTAAVNPGATEVCDDDNLDEDCSGLADDADPGVDTSTFIQYYGDADSDSYGNPNVLGALQCDPPGGQAANNGDCNDADSAVNPGATEVCDAADIDEDCNALADDADPGADVGTMSLWYPDYDSDTFGDLYASASQSCDPGPDEVADNTDCNDARADVNPMADEVCDELYEDEDCDGYVNDLDPDAIQSDWYLDNDGDGFGVIGPAAVTSCLGPANHVTESGDCDDTDSTINPDAKEYHDGVDSDCNAPLFNDFVCGEAYVQVGVTGTFQTIQAAIDAVDQVIYCDGDTIEVLPGTYNEDITVADKSPNLVGLVPANTIIQGTGAGRVVNLDRTGALFKGFQVTGGAQTGDGGGIRVFYGDGATLEDVTVTGNTASSGGGGIELRNPTNVTVRDSLVENNNAASGGGIRVSSTGGFAAGDVVLSNVDVVNNTSTGDGGGVRIAMDAVSAVSVALRDSVLEGNTAGGFGGGLSADLVPAFEITNVDVIDNTGSANHGGLHIKQAPVIIDGLLLEANTGFGVAGMQIQEFTGPISVSRVVAVDNIISQPQGNGSAIHIKGDSADGSVLHDIEVARTSRTPGPYTFSGAGLYVEGKVQASNLLIYDEIGPYGLYLLESANAVAATHDLSNVSVVGCANDGVGLGMAIATSVDLTNIITAHNGGRGVHQAQLLGTFSYSDAFGNTLGNYSQSDPTGSNGNIDTDPLFTNYSAFTASTGWDLTLGAGSPCIDTGNPGISDTDGSTSDMGYYGGPL